MKSVLYYVVTILFTLAYCVVFMLIFALTVPFDRQRAVLHRASRFWAKAIYAWPLWRVKVEGREHIEKGVPYVVTVNHQAMLDIPLMYVLPFNFKWVSKREVYRIPIFGMVLWMHGDIAIERGAASSTKKMVHEADEYLRAGTSVIIFPEGTRTKDGRVHRFKEGAFLIAKSAGVGILPCVIEGTGSLLDGWRLRMPHSFTVRILPPVSAGEVAAGEIKALAAEVNRRTTEAHQALRPDLYGNEKEK